MSLSNRRSGQSCGTVGRIMGCVRAFWHADDSKGSGVLNAARQSNGIAPAPLVTCREGDKLHGGDQRKRCVVRGRLPRSRGLFVTARKRVGAESRIPGTTPSGRLAQIPCGLRDGLSPVTQGRGKLCPGLPTFALTTPLVGKSPSNCGDYRKGASNGNQLPADAMHRPRVSLGSWWPAAAPP